MKTLSTIALLGLMALAAPSTADAQSCSDCYTQQTAGHWEIRTTQVTIPAKPSFQTRQVQVPGRWEITQERVAVPGYYKTVNRTVTVPGKWVASQCGTCTSHRARLSFGRHVRVTVNVPAHHCAPSRQWIAPTTQTVCERVWVPACYEAKPVRKWIPPCTRTEQVQVQIPARRENVQQKVWVPGSAQLACRSNGQYHGAPRVDARGHTGVVTVNTRHHGRRGRVDVGRDGHGSVTVRGRHGGIRWGW